MATLGHEMKSLRSEPQEHRVNAVEGNPRTVDPNQKEGQNATRVCNYCRTNGHTPSRCRKKIRDEESERIENQRTAEKKVTFTQDYNKKRGPHDGPEQWTRGINFLRRNQNYNNDGPTRNIPTSYQNFTPRPNFAYKNDHPNNRRSDVNAQINHAMETMEVDLEMDLSTTRMGTRETMENFPVLHRLKGGTSHKIIPTANQEIISLTALLSADPKIELRLVLRAMNKRFHSTIITHHLMFASPQLTIPLTNCRVFSC